MGIAEDKAALASIEALIQDGTTAVAVDGRSHSRNLDQLRIEADRLRRKIATGGRGGRMRSVIYNGAFQR